jgi:hypothetical protein
MKQFLTLFFVMILLAGSSYGQAIKVEVAQNEDGYYLTRGGEPYYIRGAGGHDYLDELIFLGGNSIRTWSAEDAQEILDMAHENGLTVMFGLWVQHERHGFNYDDEAAVQRQLDYFTEVVRTYKDHPALLLWGIGNEVDLFYTNTKVWDAVQDIAAMIHREDPNHPTSTVTAGLDSNEVQEVLRRAPDIDIYGVNTYGDIAAVPQNIARFGWEGPYIIAEWGPNGHWEVPKTAWGAPIEQSSTEKADSYEYRYGELIYKNRSHCIGSYVFLWGQKQETTATWYGLFSPDGEPTEPLDRIYRLWQGKELPERSPSIQSITLDGRKGLDNIYLKGGDSFDAGLEWTNEGGQKVKVEWMLYPESTVQSAGGDFESAIPPVLGALSKRKNNSVVVTPPDKEGGYRLFVFITNKSGRTAYANIPFYVIPRGPGDPPAKSIRLKSQTLEIDQN